MKLRTKFQDEDFGLEEVVDVTIRNLPDNKLELKGEASKGGVVTMYYESLQELYDNWEDAPKEPKEYWAIEIYSRGAYDFMDYNDSVDTFNKSIGNYFETKEEAEKALEKLRAWRRLQEKGFKFEAYKPYGAGITFTIAHMDELAEDSKKDLDLLFGGAE